MCRKPAKITMSDQLRQTRSKLYPGSEKLKLLARRLLGLIGHRRKDSGMAISLSSIESRPVPAINARRVVDAGASKIALKDMPGAQEAGKQLIEALRKDAQSRENNVAQFDAAASHAKASVLSLQEINDNLVPGTTAKERDSWTLELDSAKASAIYYSNEQSKARTSLNFTPNENTEMLKSIAGLFGVSVNEVQLLYNFRIPLK